jgi:hypothetical protein
VTCISSPVRAIMPASWSLPKKHSTTGRQVRLLVTISPVLHTGICLVSCNNAMCKAALVVATTYALGDAWVL